MPATKKRGAARYGPGDYIRYDGETWQVESITPKYYHLLGESQRVRGDEMSVPRRDVHRGAKLSQPGVERLERRTAALAASTARAAASCSISNAGY